DAEPLSSDLSQADRERVMGRMKAKDLRFLCATDVAARGIDISGLSHVINYTVPEQPEIYVHRTGRTGRAGKKGTAISMVGPRELGNFRYVRLTYGIKPEERLLPKDDIFIGKLKVPLPPVGIPQPPDPVQILIRGVQATASDLERQIFEKLLNTASGKRVLAALVAEKLDKLSTRTKPKRSEQRDVAAPEAGSEARPESRAGGDDRPARSDGERPRFDGDRPRRDGDRPRFREGERGDRPRFDREAASGGGDRPREGGGGDRPREGGGDRPRFEGDRPRRDYGDRGPRPARTDGPERTDAPGMTTAPVGDRPIGERPEADRAMGERPMGDRPMGDRPVGDRPSGDRGERRFDRDDRGGRGRDRDRGRDRERGHDRPHPAPSAVVEAAAPLMAEATNVVVTDAPVVEARAESTERLPRQDGDRGERRDRGGRDRHGRDRDGRGDRGDRPRASAPVVASQPVETVVEVGTEAAPVVETEAVAKVDDVARAALQRADRGKGKGKKSEPTAQTREFWETWADEKSTRAPEPAVAAAIVNDETPVEEPTSRSSRSRSSTRGGRDKVAPAKGGRAAKADDTAEKPASRAKRDATATPPPATTADSTQARLFVSLGKKHGVSADDLRELLARPIGGDKARIGSVSLRDSHAHVRVPEEHVDAIIAGVHGTQHKEQDVTVERSRA
ncbi:MAG: box helicase domain protein, partial [Deltaproteobacteria bacterium]|nr:box helicase domain protein [Deltaproteobacteria bacterium]